MRRVGALLAVLCGLIRAEKVQLAADFEDRDLSKWILPKAPDWQIAAQAGNRFLRLARGGEIGQPRRPLQFALHRDLCLSDFDLRVKVKRTGQSKSLLIAFGYQDTLHFYYAHISSDHGGHAVHNGLFKVDGGERFRIGGHGSAPVLPGTDWQEVRLVRRVATGEMVLFAGGDPEPRFAHVDTSFRWGRAGVGSFNETGDFDDFRVEGETSTECR